MSIQFENRSGAEPFTSKEGGGLIMERVINFGGGRQCGKTDAAMREAVCHIGVDLGSTPSTTVLLVPSYMFAKGEMWIRETYGMPESVVIVESPASRS